MSVTKTPVARPASAGATVRIGLQDIAPSQRAVLENLFQLYTYDFTEHWAGTDKGELGEDGRYPATTLDTYWSAPDHHPLLIRVNGHVAGFALLNSRARSGMDTDINIADFFIARKHRGGGVGRLVAHALFDRFPGQWEVAIARQNTGAQTFWRRAAETYARATDIGEIEVLNANWNGPVQRFWIAAPQD
jgi:predicted acetyltransferase